MANTYVEDGDILWLAINKVGNPPVWQQGTIYNIGDVVVPVNPDSGQTNLAFQCVGFLGKSAAVQPVFPTVGGNTIVDGGVIWKAVDPIANPDKLAYNEYYVIEQSVTINP
jgi:hypothetical protein